jgi:hypothetical protein
MRTNPRAASCRDGARMSARSPTPSPTLAGDDASFVTATELAVDGGYLAR